MNASLKIAAMGLCICGLAACASNQDKTTYAPGTRVAPADQQDDAYVARVESIARARGITVRWVNPPTKHASAVASQ